MSATKTETITFRIDPHVKDVLRAIAQQERRSLTNMIEVLMLDYCRRHDGYAASQKIQAISTEQKSSAA